MIFRFGQMNDLVIIQVTQGLKNYMLRMQEVGAFQIKGDHLKQVFCTLRYIIESYNLYNQF